jgi:hypothetical protein
MMCWEELRWVTKSNPSDGEKIPVCFQLAIAQQLISRSRKRLGIPIFFPLEF